eukprot:1052752-Pleurochrysis_carterae.AAC.1
MPKSWYTIVGRHFEGVRLANYSVISAEISAYPNCRIFGAAAGVTDEASASQLLREVRKQRVRDAMEGYELTMATPAPIPRPQP